MTYWLLSGLLILYFFFTWFYFGRLTRKARVEFLRTIDNDPAAARQALKKMQVYAISIILLTVTVGLGLVIYLVIRGNA